MPKDSIKISIVIPVFNAEKTIKDCLDKIVNQSLKEIEILCVNDCSTDASKSIIESLAKKDSRIRLINKDINSSANIARIDGAMAATGKYILFVDPDDGIVEGALEKLYQIAEKANVDILHFGTDIVNFGVTEQQVEWYKTFAKPYYGILKGKEVFRACFIEKKYRFNIWNKLYKSELCKKAMAECKYVSLPKAQDLYEFFVIAFNAESYYGIPEKFYIYNFGGGITGGRKFTAAKYKRHCEQSKVAYYLIQYLKEKGVLTQYYQAPYIAISDLINDNIASLKICGKQKVDFSAEKIFCDAWLSDNFAVKLYEEINTTEDYYLAKLLFEICFKIYKNISIKTRDEILKIFKGINEKYPQTIPELISENDVQSKDYMFLHTVMAAIKSEQYKNKYVPICFASDNQYVPYLAVALNSLLKNIDKSYFYDIYVMHTGIDGYYINKLNSQTETGIYQVNCINVKSIIINQNLYSNRHYSTDMYHRFLIPELFFFMKKVMYLDCDLIVLNSIHKLYQFDLGEHVLGVARNLLHNEMNDYVENKLKCDPSAYFNSGVLLINCEKFIQQRIKHKCYEFLKKNTDLHCPDQDALNICCKDVVYFDVNWNFQWHHLLNKNAGDRYSLVENDIKLLTNAVNDVCILHFTSNKKPWNYTRSIYSDMFWEYAESSLFYREILINGKDGAIEYLKNEVIKLKKEISALKQDKGGNFQLQNPTEEKKEGIIKRIKVFYRLYGLKMTIIRIFAGRKFTKKLIEKRAAGV